MPIHDLSRSDYPLRAFGIRPNTGRDVTEDIQDVCDIIRRNNGGKIIPEPGVYNLESPTTVGGISYLLGLTGDNISIEGTPGSMSIFRTTQNASIFWAWGAGKPNGIANWNSFWSPNRPKYGIAPATKGATKVTCTTPTDAGRFAENDIIYFATGQTINGDAFHQPDAEYNIVAAPGGNPTTGDVPVQRPLAKDYAQEYYVAGTTGETTTTVTPNPAPFGISNVSDAVLRNVAIRHMGLEAPNCVVTAVAKSIQIIGFFFEYNNLIGGGNIGSFSNLRDGFIHKNRVNHVGNGLAYFFAVDTGSSDVEISSNIGDSSGLIYLHMHEGTSRIIASRNRLLSKGIATSDPIISVRGRAHDNVITENHGYKGAGTGSGIFIDYKCTGGGIVSRNTMLGSFSQPYNIGAPNWIDADNRPVAGRHLYIDNLTLRSIAGGMPPSKQEISAVWVSPNDPTPIIVTTPPDSVIDRVEMNVKTAFDSPGTDTISVGIDGNQAIFATATDVSTTGVKTVTLGTVAKDYRGVATVVKAFYTAGGAAPTVGRVLVEVYWHRTALQTTG